MLSHLEDEIMMDKESSSKYDYDECVFSATNDSEKTENNCDNNTYIEQLRATRNIPVFPRPQLKGKFESKTSFSERTRLMEMINLPPSCIDRLFKSTIFKGSDQKVTDSSHFVLFNLTAYFADDDDENNNDKSAEQVLLFSKRKPFKTTYPKIEDVKKKDKRRHKKKPLLSRLDHLMSGYALALANMTVGETAEFAIHWSLAYGQLGCPLNEIPPATSLIVILELVKVFKPATFEYFWAVERGQEENEDVEEEEEEECFTPEQILAFASQDWALGNQFYRDSKFQKALYHFRRTINMLERRSRHFVIEESVEEQVKTMLLSLYSNAASCGIKLSRGPLVLNYARRTLKIDSKSAKAYFQLAHGSVMLENVEQACHFIEKARQLRSYDLDIMEAIKVMQDKMDCVDMMTCPNALYAKPKIVALYKNADNDDDAPSEKGEEREEGDGDWEIDENFGSVHIEKLDANEVISPVIIESVKNQSNGEKLLEIDESRFEDFYST